MLANFATLAVASGNVMDVIIRNYKFASLIKGIPLVPDNYAPPTDSPNKGASIHGRVIYIRLIAILVRARVACTKASRRRRE